MNDQYLARALKQIPDPKILTIVTSRRARILARGGRPMIKTDEGEFLNIALLEVAEGLLTYTEEDED